MHLTETNYLPRISIRIIYVNRLKLHGVIHSDVNRHVSCEKSKANNNNNSQYCLPCKPCSDQHCNHTFGVSNFETLTKLNS